MSETDTPTVALVERQGGPGGIETNLYHCAQCEILCEEGLLDDYGRCPKCAAARGEYLDDLATERAIDLRFEKEAGCT